MWRGACAALLLALWAGVAGGVDFGFVSEAAGPSSGAWRFSHNAARVEAAARHTPNLTTTAVLVDSGDPSEAAWLIRSLGTSGADVAFFTTNALEPQRAAAADAFPQTLFLNVQTFTGHRQDDDNVRGSVRFPDGSALAVAGRHAARVSARKVAGVLAAEPVDLAQPTRTNAFTNAFAVGFLSGGGQRVLVVEMPAAGGSAAAERTEFAMRQLVELGCDVFITNELATPEHMHRTAAALTAELGDPLHTVGYGFDEQMFHGGTVCTSVYVDWLAFYDGVFTQVAAGTFEGVPEPSELSGFVRIASPSSAASFGDRQAMAGDVRAWESTGVGENPFCGPLVASDGVVVVAPGECWAAPLYTPWLLSGVDNLGGARLPGEACASGAAAFNATSWAFSCFPCAAGTRSTGAGCEPCLRGETSALVSAANATQICVKCPPGTEGPTAGGICQPCSTTAYSNMEGFSTCEPCPWGLKANAGRTTCDAPVPLLLGLFGLLGVVLIALLAVCSRQLTEWRPGRKRYTAPVVAAVASYAALRWELGDLDYLRALKTKTYPQKSFLAIMDVLKMYRPFLPLTKRAEYARARDSEGGSVGTEDAQQSAADASSEGSSSVLSGKVERALISRLVGGKRKPCAVLVAAVLLTRSTIRGEADAYAREVGALTEKLIAAAAVVYSFSEDSILVAWGATSTGASVVSGCQTLMRLREDNRIHAAHGLCNAGDVGTRACKFFTVWGPPVQATQLMGGVPGDFVVDSGMRRLLLAEGIAQCRVCLRVTSSASECTIPSKRAGHYADDQTVVQLLYHVYLPADVPQQPPKRDLSGLPPVRPQRDVVAGNVLFTQLPDLFFASYHEAKQTFLSLCLRERLDPEPDWLLSACKRAILADVDQSIAYPEFFWAEGGKLFLKT
ncbi:hypothetical protein DIPPA_19798 [Diplonema papillatum]|nr:hypothetical protein DIPPA_19798 [Diplonema papillatum]